MICVASAKGAPGVTTVTLLLGALWPRPIMAVEADPSGGDIALRMPSPNGEPLDTGRGLLSLVAAGRRSLYPQLVREHAQKVIGGLDVLVGVSAPEQATGINQWAEFGELLRQLPGMDVVADLGRIGDASPQNRLLATSSAICLVTGTVPSQVVHLRERIRRLHETYPEPAPVHVLVVAPAKRSRAVREVREALEQANANVSGVHHLAEDGVGAGFFLGQVSGRPQRTHLVRSMQPIAAELAELTHVAFVPGVAGVPDPDLDPGSGPVHDGRDAS